MSLKAITATQVKDYLATMPGLTLPSSFTDPKLEAIIERKTALVLDLRGLTALPEAGSLELDRVANAVLGLCVIECKRILQPDRDDMMRLLIDEERLIRRDLEVVRDEAPKRKHWGVGVRGAYP